jgi:hypothetical protein
MAETAGDCLFALLQQVAAGGQRCPTNADITAYLRERGFRTAPRDILKCLTREGRVIVRVYANNWRDVVIATGPHTGKTTMPPPHHGKPYIVIDAIERAKRDAQPVPRRSRSTVLRSR